MKTDLDRLFLFLLIISTLLHGVGSQMLFFVTTGILIYRNRYYIRNNLYKKRFLFVVILYLIPLAVLLWNSYPDITWRPIGITKCMCGLALCMLMSDRVCRKDIGKMILFFMIFLNVMGTYVQIIGRNIFGVFEFPGHNSCVCLNLIFIPHFIAEKKEKMTVSRLMYYGSLVALTVSYLESSTLWIGGILIIILNIWFSLKRKLPSLGKSLRKVLFATFSGVVLVLLYSFLFRADTQQAYLNVIGKFDISRAEILSYGINRLSLPIHEQIWGSGEILYAVAYGRLIQAHNFIIESLSMYGMVGVCILVLDVLFFWIYIFKYKNNPNYEKVFVSLMGGYLCFMVHPFYTTSFIIKIFMVMVNMRALYVGGNR